MSVPRSLRRAVPVDGHGFAATVADFLDLGDHLPPSRDERRGARRAGRYMQRWCGDCRAHNRWLGRLSRMRSEYRRRSR